MKGFWTVLMLVFSNVFMTFAWYGHLKLQEMKISTGWPLILIILFSWGLAFFEYCLTVPANRIGYTTLTLAQLKIMQEVITLSVFVPFSVFFMGEKFRLDFVWAALCLCGAVFFIFRK